jgi:hypothetical protein
VTNQELLTKLRELGVTAVEAEYSGSGDEGQINELTAYRPSADPAEGKVEIELPAALHEAADEALSGLLYAKYGSWYDNDGGCGTVELDVATGQAKFDFGWYETVTKPDPFEASLLDPAPEAAQ